MKRLSDLTRSFPERPPSDDIHDLRVAARRVQAMVRVLPKGIRKSKRAKRFRNALESLLKSTSEVRDMDTLIETLGIEKGSLPAEVLRSLENERSDLAATTRRSILAFARAKAPPMDPSKISPKKLARRLRNQEGKQFQVMSALLPEVTGDESKVKELHTLRKEVKKLRYVKELGDGLSSELEILIQWQEALGAVHDLDVAVDYLKAGRWRIPESVLEDLRHKRHSRYVHFLGIGLGGHQRIFSVSAMLPKSAR